MLATAGKLVFAGDGGGNIVAHDALTGKPLWHSQIGGVTNPPQTYMLDGRQYLLVASRRHAVRVRHVCGCGWELISRADPAQLPGREAHDDEAAGSSRGSGSALEW